MSLAVWLMSLIGPLVLQALVALGVGLVTVTGVDLAINTAMQWMTTAVGGLSANMLNVLAMSGAFQGLSYIGGAISARIAMAGAASMTRWIVQ